MACVFLYIIIIGYSTPQMPLSPLDYTVNELPTPSPHIHTSVSCKVGVCMTLSSGSIICFKSSHNSGKHFNVLVYYK